MNDFFFKKTPVQVDLTDGQKKAIVSMFANGTSVRDLAKWYEVDQAVIREVLLPHVRFEVDSDKR